MTDACDTTVLAHSTPTPHDSTMRSRRERGRAGALGPSAKGVWVGLKLVYPQLGFVDALPSGLDLDREVPGGLWDWVRGSDGQWFGVVTFHVPYRDERTERYIADRQLIPARALRPR